MTTPIGASAPCNLCGEFPYGGKYRYELRLRKDRGKHIVSESFISGKNACCITQKIALPNTLGDPDSPSEKLKARYSDVFHASYFEDVDLASPYDLPTFHQANLVPDKLLPFDKAIKKTDGIDYSCFVHFFIQDVVFERFWTNPHKYIPILKRFRGCICPDFSLYYDMPYPQLLYNTFRNRLLGAMMAKAGIDVIMNVSFGDERTLDFSTCGIEKGSVIATGSLGTIKNASQRATFHTGLEWVLSTVRPSDLLIFGTVTDKTETLCRQFGTKLHIFAPVWDGSFITRRNSYGQR